MSVVTCKKCAARYEDSSKVCPVCGTKPPRKTSVLVWILAAIIAAVFLKTAFSGSPARAPVSVTEAPSAEKSKEIDAAIAKSKADDERPVLSQQQQDFVVFLKSSAQKTIKDAVWMSRENLYVGAIDDKTNRKGLAEYVCSAAVDYGVQPAMVKIIDIVEVSLNGKFREIGKTHCK